MLDKKQLEIEINLLLSLPYIHAYTGELGDLKERSYVSYSYILDLLTDRRILLKNFLRNIESYKDFKEGMKIYSLNEERILYVHKSKTNNLVMRSKDENPLYSRWIDAKLDIHSYKIIE